MANQTIAVMGGTGFIGRHLLETLTARRTRVLVHRAQPSWLGGLSHVEPVQGDIFDPASLDRLMQGCDVLINLTGQVEGPVDRYLDVNVRGTLNLSQACVRQHVRRVIHASSALVYGDMLNATEEMPCHPFSPYATMKCAAEEIIRSVLAPTTEVMCFRLSNVYGSGQTKGLIPYLVDCIRNRRRVSIDADGAQIRDFVYVKDVAAVFGKALATADWAKLVNIGSGVPTSVITLLRQIEEVLELPAIGQYCPEHTGGERRNTLSIERAASVLGWRATTTLEEGLRAILRSQTVTVNHEVAA
ncbi:MAG: NAD-dependent epimerase/dehydratase family protein [Nitrospira sp.]|nr:NAD-dependent epimerase/dehydratase family protein [Nitrospira sp.]TKB34684.1 MAG: NAD-dependent epimerase/dehydratase family protein [Nitrospira sp.]